MRRQRPVPPLAAAVLNPDNLRKGKALSVEVRAGLDALRQGFAMWGTSPKLMFLGALPALIVGTVFLAAFVMLLFAVTDLAVWMTPFADSWSALWRTVVRVTVGAVVVVVSAFTMVTTFAAVTLLVGDPFYEQIAVGAERRLGAPPLGRDESWWDSVVRSSGDGIRLAAAGLLLAVGLFFVGLIPGVGGVLDITLGALIGGRLLVTDMTGRALEPRGFSLDDRRALMKNNRARTNAFGAATYLLFLVPILSVVTMPAAVAGAVILARGLLPEPDKNAPGSGNGGSTPTTDPNQLR